jgi:hypothetical protein
VEDTVRTVAYYVKVAAEMTGNTFIAAYNHPVLIEKIGDFPHEDPSLLSGTVLLRDTPDVLKVGGDSSDLAMYAAKVFALRKKPGSMGADIFVGRGPTNDVILPSRSVSKSHAHFAAVPDTGDYELVDKFSSNGTFLNGNKIPPFEKHRVKDFDLIGFGPDFIAIYYLPRTFYEMLRSVRI